MSMKNMGVLVAVILIVVMMVIPIPTFMLDILLILNLSMAIMILLITMNMKEALDFSIFPSVVLLTTLFRLALSVSTTRSILSHADGGKVIEAFGSFVIGGNAVVGFIVFLILVIIQFIVITKGSERVAEVAARFTLDAMPGKQMSIDADLNTGMINDQEARARRKKVEQEADFYGSMDGASKFVKGDAIASIIILIINITAGFAIGMTTHGMALTEAVSTFTLLSVGDGLVSQIPALLISTATGIVVTRAASEGSLGDDLTNQMFSYPHLLYIVAGVIALFGLFTPIGIFLTWGIAGLLAFAGYQIQKKQTIGESVDENNQAEQELEEVRKPENVFHLLREDPIEFEFGIGLIMLADVNQGGDLLDRVVAIRRQIAMELGLVVPVIRIRDNIQLQHNEYVIKIKGNPVAGGEIMLDHFLMLNPVDEEHGIGGVETTEPTFGLPALWITEGQKEEAELFGYTVIDPSSVISTHLSETIKKYAHEVLGREETSHLINHLKETHPSLVEELIPNVLSLGDIQKVLQKLLKENVSIRSLSVIFEALAEYAAYTKNTDILTEYVRQSLSRQLTSQHVENGIIHAIQVGAGIEKKLAESIQRSEQGDILAIDPESANQLIHSFTQSIQEMAEMGVRPVILSSSGIRMYVRQLLERAFSDIPILSYNELEPNVEVKSVGVVKV
ncbi:flagellar biosynthesis protein FlhA [Neobacillus notoginsengisoli]|uniref:Flagellar biosynthesis protein FlhA n=1 Tax=Neobacillus notoginsengisoli TaxID=1578198 RepID=A0A417YJQ1_9BACI|nr:flagellar biosynthesis protein FlhA [Neobacillus notoginsengisoli]RHW33298.1 flagellar biosynthesis protein FlhA [Neobacillus notoginsengisoli]